MKRMGLSLVAILAFSAMAASSAFAGEYITCVKTAKVDRKYTGKYTNDTCSTLGEDGKYERASPSFPVTARSATKEAVLSTAGGDIKCKKSNGTVTILGPRMGLTITTLEECELGGFGERCTSLSAYEETGQYNLAGITMLSLTELIDHGGRGPSGLEPASGEVWDAFSADPESALYPYQAVYICEPGIIFRTSGSASAVVSPVNAKASKKATLAFRSEKGEQDLATEFSQNGGDTWESTGPNVETASVSIKYASSLEVAAGEP
jgi:hypothetical protein